MQLINIGYGNMVSAARVIAIVAPDSAPIKRLIQESRVVLSAVSPETVCGRAAEEEVEEDE